MALIAPCAEAAERLRTEGARLPDRQRTMLEEGIARSLGHRADLYADRERYPVIARQEIAAPLVVTGMPRSGTTLLHGVLAQDPRGRSPRWWETVSFSPPAGLDPEADARRVVLTHQITESLGDEFLSVHRKGPFLPNECSATFMDLSLQSLTNFALFGTVDHANWVARAADMAPAFATHRHCLQHLQAFRPGDWWVLKSPEYLYWANWLLAEYPDAQVVVIHRDPAQVLPSCASMFAFLRRRSGLAVDPVAVGREVLDFWGGGLEHMMAFRRHNPATTRFIDVRHRDLSRDPIGTIRRIYSHFGRELTAEAETAMEAFMAQNGMGKHGGHHYTPEEFGMSAEGLRERFADYIAAYL